MELNPTILRQAQTFAFLVRPWRVPPAARRCYRASGLDFMGRAARRWRLRRGNQTMERPYVKTERLEQMPHHA